MGTAFFLAELGDKTMLATVTLAAETGGGSSSSTAALTGVWAGSTIGMVAADALAIAVGRALGRRLPDRLIKYAAAAAFAIFGLLLIIDGTHSLS